MNIRTLLVSGDKFMIDRHKFLLQEMSSHIPSIQHLSVGDVYESKALKQLFKLIRRKLPFIPSQSISKLRKNKLTFISKSEKNEQAIRELSFVPDLILHFYGLYSPLWHQFNIPYITYLDYTMALAAQHWKPWSPFPSKASLNEWLDCERKAYQNAAHLFTKSNCAKNSLIQHYEIHPEKITVIQASGNFLTPYQGKKTFGSKQILFNGSDFHRKGGDILLEAFRIVRHSIPDATLVIVGEEIPLQDAGVYNPGHISSGSRMEEIFLQSDLVVSPARCEPLGIFLIDAMNYGVPCVVSDQDGMPEIVENRRNGIVIAQPSPEKLATEIIALLSDFGVLMGLSENARLKIQAQLNWKSIAKRMIETIEGLEVQVDQALIRR